MTHKDKITWLAVWAAEHDATLNLHGSCGFGRECVGISRDGTYPDYEWYSEDGLYNRADSNGNVWIPEDAYHKHPCVAVLGRGEKAEAQLYEWVKWFEDNGFELVSEDVDPSKELSEWDLLLGKYMTHRMIRRV